MITITPRLTECFDVLPRVFTPLLLVFILASCAVPPSRPTTEPITTPRPLKQAIRQLTHDLLAHLPVSEAGVRTIVLNPFVDANSGDVVKTSEHIASLMKETLAVDGLPYTLEPVRRENLDDTYYVLSGAILYEKYTAAGAKHYQIQASLVRSRQIIAHSAVWLAEDALDYTPLSTQGNSPSFLKKRGLDTFLAITRGEADIATVAEYIRLLRVDAILREADQAYQQGEYPQALSLYENAARYPDGQILKTYAGLYQTYFRQRKLAEAEKAFGDMLRAGVESESWSAKFLFAVNSTAFQKNKSLLAQYPIWLRQIGRYFQRSDKCLYIVGHSSRSGSMTHNDRLSRQRAESIQTRLKPYFPNVMQRSKIAGRGFRENLAGLGTDDITDALDRRVELLAVECGRL